MAVFDHLPGHLILGGEGRGGGKGGAGSRQHHLEGKGGEGRGGEGQVKRSTEVSLCISFPPAKFLAFCAKRVQRTILTVGFRASTGDAFYDQFLLAPKRARFTREEGRGVGC